MGDLFVVFAMMATTPAISTTRKSLDDLRISRWALAAFSAAATKVAQHQRQPFQSTRAGGAMSGSTLKGRVHETTEKSTRIEEILLGTRGAQPHFPRFDPR